MISAVCKALFSGLEWMLSSGQSLSDKASFRAWSMPVSLSSISVMP